MVSTASVLQNRYPSNQSSLVNRVNFYPCLCWVEVLHSATGQSASCFLAFRWLILQCQIAKDLSSFSFSYRIVREKLELYPQEKIKWWWTYCYFACCGQYELLVVDREIFECNFFVITCCVWFITNLKLNHDNLRFTPILSPPKTTGIPKLCPSLVV